MGKTVCHTFLSLSVFFVCCVGGVPGVCGAGGVDGNQDPKPVRQEFS